MCVVEDQALLFKQLGDALLVDLAFGDIGIRGNEAAAGQGRAADFKHCAVWACPFVGMGDVLRYQRHGVAHMGVDIDLAIFTTLGVVTQHGFEAGLRIDDKGVGQIEQLPEHLVVLDDLAVLVNQCDAEGKVFNQCGERVVLFDELLFGASPGRDVLKNFNGAHEPAFVVVERCCREIQPGALRPHFRKEVFGLERAGHQYRAPVLLLIIRIDTTFKIPTQHQIGHDRSRFRVKRLPLVGGTDQAGGGNTEYRFARPVPVGDAVRDVDHKHRHRRALDDAIQKRQLRDCCF